MGPKVEVQEIECPIPRYEVRVVDKVVNVSRDPSREFVPAAANILDRSISAKRVAEQPPIVEKQTVATSEEVKKEPDAEFSFSSWCADNPPVMQSAVPLRSISEAVAHSTAGPGQSHSGVSSLVEPTTSATPARESVSSQSANVAALECKEGSSYWSYSTGPARQSFNEVSSALDPVPSASSATPARQKFSGVSSLVGPALQPPLHEELM